MDIELLLGFLMATALLAAMPGPDNIYVLTESIAKGIRQGVSITAGLVSGVVVHTLLVATGLSMVVFEFDVAFNIVKYVGAAYLLYLAWGAFKEGSLEVKTGEKAEPEPFFKLFKRGIMMNILNPKVAIFFIVLLPQFVSAEGWHPFWQMSLMGIIFMVESFIIFSLIAVMAGKLASMVQHPTFWVVTRWIKVVVLVALAALLFIAERQAPEINF